MLLPVACAASPAASPIVATACGAGPSPCRNARNTYSATFAICWLVRTFDQAGIVVPGTPRAIDVYNLARVKARFVFAVVKSSGL